MNVDLPFQQYAHAFTLTIVIWLVISGALALGSGERDISDQKRISSLITYTGVSGQFSPKRKRGRDGSRVCGAIVG
jgi:hypothetical protein